MTNNSLWVRSMLYLEDRGSIREGESKVLKLNIKGMSDPGELSLQSRSLWLACGSSVRAGGLVVCFHLDHLLVAPVGSLTLIIIVLALQLCLIHHQRVVVLQVVVVDPPEAFFQVMVLDALKALVDPEYDADGDDKDEDKDDEAKLGCRGAPSRT